MTLLRAVQSRSESDVTTFTVTSPHNGEPLTTHPLHGPQDVADAITRVRAGAEWWRELGFDGRREVLDRWRGSLARRAGELARIVALETGKPDFDAELEVTLALEHLAWASRSAKKVLSARTVRSGLLMASQTATLERRPYGVVGVIGPWNYPVFTPMGSIVYALAAGNTVVFKPSELTPASGEFLARTLSWATAGRPVLEVVTGSASTGEALCAAGVDKIAFTGSSVTAKKVMSFAAQLMTPVVIEAGGKDAMIIDEDADLDAAADACAWGSFSNAGQTCLGVERVYAHRSVRDEFLRRLLKQMDSIRHGDREDAQYGPMTLSRQVDVVRDHIDGALARGARAITVGGREVRSADDVIDGRFIAPTVLLDVPDDADAVTQETFGPTVTVHSVDSMHEAVRRANAVAYGLGASIFAGERADEIVAGLRTGCVSVNSVISFAAVAQLPLGGVGDSGFGRVHGEDGLREFTYARAVTRQRFATPFAITSFARTPRTELLTHRVTQVLHGSVTLLPPWQGGRRGSGCSRGVPGE